MRAGIQLHGGMLVWHMQGSVPPPTEGKKENGRALEGSRGAEGRGGGEGKGKEGKGKGTKKIIHVVDMLVITALVVVNN